jgi:hypothetical protein
MNVKSFPQHKIHNFLTSCIAIKLFGKTDLYGASYVNCHIALNHDMFTPVYAYLLLAVSLFLLYNDLT